jgi:chromosome segregation ATPase
MSDFSELQARLTAALDRIGSGLEALGRPAAGDTAEMAQLREALDEERTANAQLEERVRAIREKQDDTVEKLASEVDRLRGLLETEEAAVAQLRRVNGDLRANNAALREAVSKTVSEPHLVNKSMMAELEALRATRAADRAELDAVLGELGPLMAEVRNLGDLGGETGGEVSDA